MDDAKAKTTLRVVIFATGKNVSTNSIPSIWM